MGIRESGNRAAALGVLCLAIVAILMNGQSLLAQGYSRYASENFKFPYDDDSGLTAAQLAARLSPYPASSLALQARQLARHGEPEKGLQLFQQAVSTAPTNPFLWLEFSEYLVQLGVFTEDLAVAIAEAQHLAPRNYALHYQIAKQAVQHWEWGNAAQQRRWVDSILLVINTDPQPLLRFALLERRSEVLCDEPLLKRDDLTAWCAGAKVARSICFQPVVPTRSQKWCQSLGYVQDQLQDSPQ